MVDDAPLRSPRYIARGNSSLTEVSAGLFATDVYALSAAICDARAAGCGGESCVGLRADCMRGGRKRVGGDGREGSWAVSRGSSES